MPDKDETDETKILQTFRLLGLEKEEDRQRFRELAKLSPKKTEPELELETWNNTGKRDG